MGRDKGIKIYTLNENGKYDLEEKYTNSSDFSYNARISKYCTTQDGIEYDGLTKENYDLLHTNPFMYEVQKDDNAFSIEDFYVKYKKSSFQFGAVLRSEDFKKRKRNKIIKKNLISWKKEVKQRLDNAIVNGKNTLDAIKVFKVPYIPIKNKLYLCGGIILCALLLLNIIPIGSILTELVRNTSYCLLALLSLGLLLGIFQDEKAHRYYKRISKDNSLYIKYKKELTKELKQNSRKIKKHYLNSLSNPKFKKPPLKIEKISLGEKRIKHIEAMCEKYNKEAVTNRTHEKEIRFFYDIPVMISYLVFVPAAYIVVNAGYTLVNNLITGGN